MSRYSKTRKLCKWLKKPGKPYWAEARFMLRYLGVLGERGLSDAEIVEMFRSTFPDDVSTPVLENWPTDNAITGRSDTTNRGIRTDGVKKYEGEYFHDDPYFRQLLPLIISTINNERTFDTLEELTEAVYAHLEVQKTSRKPKKAKRSKASLELLDSDLVTVTIQVKKSK